MERQAVLKRSVAIMVGCIVMMSGQLAQADVIVHIPALQNATLFGASPLNNNSSSGPGMFVGSDGQGNPKRGLIEFDIASLIPANATISSVTLTLFLGQVAGQSQIPRTIRLFDVTTNWAGGTNGTTGFPGPGFGGTGGGFPPNIGDVTWNFAQFNSIPWTTPGGGGDFVATESANLLVTQNVDTAYVWGSTPQMVSDVQGWLDGTLSNFGWLLKNDSEADTQSFRAFYTREGALEQGVPQFAPDLTVTFLAASVPEPSTLWLMTLGAVLTISLLRRPQRG